MSGHVAAIFRHPVKGFTPEPLNAAELVPGQGLAHDRVWAVENGPSGFDPAHPGHVPKQKFTVLMSLPRIASVRTRYEDETGLLHADYPGCAPIAADFTHEAGRAAFADWLTPIVGDDARGPLRVIAAPGQHRFTDHPKGQVSIVNLASVRDLETRLGRPVDPLRFRANVYIEGWPAWAENDWVGQTLALGWARAEVFKPIVRCAATHVDPATGARDIELTRALFDNYGHMHCGLYVQVTGKGALRVGDACPARVAETVETPQWA